MKPAVQLPAIFPAAQRARWRWANVEFGTGAATRDEGVAVPQISRFALDCFRLGKIDVRHCVQIAGLSDLRTWRGASEISVCVSAAAECGFQKWVRRVAVPRLMRTSRSGNLCL